MPFWPYDSESALVRPCLIVPVCRGNRKSVSKVDKKGSSGRFCGIIASQNSSASHHSGLATADPLLPHMLQNSLLVPYFTSINAAPPVQPMAVCISQTEELCLLLLQVVRDGGSVLSCALNATCAALIDAGVLLHNMFGKLYHLSDSLYISSD